MSDVFNFTIKKSEDFAMEMLVRDKETHEPIDLSDATFVSDCRDNLKSDIVLFSFVFEVAADQINNKGEVIMSVDQDTTAALEPSAGVYDVFVTYEVDGARQPFMQGKITFATAVTRVTI